MSDAYREPIDDGDEVARLREKFLGGGGGHLTPVRSSREAALGIEPVAEVGSSGVESSVLEAAQNLEMGAAAQTEAMSMPEIAPERAKVETNRDSMYGKILRKIRAKKTDDDSDAHAHTVAGDARAGAMHTDADAQISHLIDLATTKGAIHAVKVAKHMENYYIMDVLHDKMLADKLHDALEAKGLI